MRLPAILIAVLASTSAVSAETIPERVVAMFKEICVVPAAPEDMIAAGERRAEVERWKLVKSGRGPIPIMHNEDGPPQSLVRAWEHSASDAPIIRVAISVVGPELPDSRFDVCAVQVAGKEFDERLTLEVERQFGSSASKRRPEYALYAIGEWLLAWDGKPDCRKLMALTRISYTTGPFTQLSLLDLARRKDGEWQGTLTVQECKK
jgi:hypothetical protein